MDIHKPKAAHSWREFAIEIGTIICGILIALGLEQAVEAARSRHEVEEARRALGEEIASNLEAVDETAAQFACASARLDELTRWQRSLEGGAPIKLAAPAASPTYVALRSNVWRVASAAGVARMSFEERLKYGAVYDATANIDLVREDGRHHWESVAQASAAHRLTTEEINRLGGDLTLLRQIYGLLKSNFGDLHRLAGQLGIKPAPLDEQDTRKRAESVCRSLISGVG